MPPSPPSTSTRSKVSFGSIPKAAGQRAVIYGPGGIGKTTACVYLKGKTAVVDADESMPVLAGQLREANLLDNLTVVNGVSDWLSLRSAIQSDGWDGIDNILLDTGTKIEEWALQHTLRTNKLDANSYASSIEDYGYGKGYTYLFETFMPLLADLDRHIRAGRNVVVVCHDCLNNVRNPDGEDYIRYEPRLMTTSNGKFSIRLRVREWADHVLFVNYDLNVEKKPKQLGPGKATGSGTRTVYTSERPSYMAKSRTTQQQIPVIPGESFWDQIIK